MLPWVEFLTIYHPNMMRFLFTTILALLPLVSAVETDKQPEQPVQQQPDRQEKLPPPPLTHSEAAHQLIDLLQQTEACLAACRDEGSVCAALPELQRLARLARHIARGQQNLSEPTTQDYIAAQQLAGEFNTAWEAIRTHIARLEKDHLLSPQMREILCIDPSTENSNQSPSSPQGK